MDLQTLATYLEALKGTAAQAASPAATAMAEGFRHEVADVTLRQATHAPHTFYRAPVGRPPAYASGNLAKSIRVTRAYGAVRATAMTGAYARYAAIQEWGGWTEPRRGRYMHWRNPRAWWRKHVDIPEHPYFRPTRDRMIATGALSRDARDAFWARISPYFTG